MRTTEESMRLIKLNLAYPRTKDGERYHIVKSHGAASFETACGLTMKFADGRCVGKHIERFDDAKNESLDFHLQFCVDCFGSE